MSKDVFLHTNFLIIGKMVESKKALPKEPRLSFYSSYTSQYYGGQGQLSPPGGRNYYGPNPYQGMYMNGNRYYQQNSAQVRTYKVRIFNYRLDSKNTNMKRFSYLQGYYDRSTNNSNEKSNSYNDSERGHYYKFNNNQTQSESTSNYSGNRNRYAPHHQDKSMDDHQLKYYNDYKPNDLNMFSHFNNPKLNQDGSSGGGSYSGSAGADVTYEEDFPELGSKFSQLRLDTRISPINVPSNKDYCF